MVNVQQQQMCIVPPREDPAPQQRALRQIEAPGGLFRGLGLRFFLGRDGDPQHRYVDPIGEVQRAIRLDR